MKSFLITFLTLTTFFQSLLGQWELINKGLEDYDRIYNSGIVIDLVSKDAGWMSYGYSILKTKNGGETWSPVSWNLGDIADCEFINDSVCWVIPDIKSQENSSWLYKTIDGGNNWEKMLDMGRSHEGYYAKMLFASEDIVVVSTRELTMIKSTDGGSTWEDITPLGYEEYAEDLNSISFAGSDTGVYIKPVDCCYPYVFPNTLYRTLDGGRTWEEKSLPQFQNLREIGFIDHQTGYLLAQNASSWSGDNNHVICITEDAFKTWTVVTKNQYPIWNFHCFNNQIYMAILEDGKRSKIVKSYNRGRSWVECESPGFFESEWPFDISFGDSYTGIIYSDKCWVCGDAVSILKSTDQGDTWSFLNLSYPFKDVCFKNSQNGFAVGGGGGEGSSFGDILSTTNGGKSWKFIHSGPYPIVSCNFVNGSIGFAQASMCVQQGLYSTNLYQTSDGGTNWFVYPHEFNPDTRFKFINEQVGFAGNDSGIYMTFNGGDTWDLLFSSTVTSIIIKDLWYLKNFMATITASDENTFWAIAGDNNVIRFTSEGAWERIDLETKQNLYYYKIFFKDLHTGWIAPGARCWFDRDLPTLFKTEDGGESWIKIEGPYQFRDIYFKDAQYGWAVGNNSLCQGVIMETTNGGIDWTVQVDSLSAPLNAIDYKDGYAWAVGENGLILKMYDSTYISAIESPNSAIEGNSPLHLYPNPTNSILHMETEISGQKSIELLNLNGQLLLRTVVTETNFQLDLSSFQKGVYLITIRSKNFVTTKKVLKL